MSRFDRSGLRGGFGRERLLELLDAGLSAVDPARCVRAALSRDGDRLRVGWRTHSLAGRKVWTIAIGKAAVPMSEAAAERLGPVLAGGVAVTRYGYGGSVHGIDVLEAGHPIPDEAGRAAAAAVGGLADGLGAADLAICLLSGGGSALLASPPSDLPLEDLADTTRLLLESGATIDEVNAVRRHVSTLQGGRLARRLRPASLVTLALSDVIGDRRESIASGPTAPDPTTFADALDVLRRYRLWDRAPDSVRDLLARGVEGRIDDSLKPGDPAFRGTDYAIVGNNGTCLDAIDRAARRLSVPTSRLEEPITGEARDVGRALARRAMRLARDRSTRTLLIAGGETTVTVRGTGRGGRNQELVLAAALEIDRLDGVCLAAMGTDGSDGITDAAGGIVDGATVDRARRVGVDPVEALADNDSHAALAASGDLLVTGPTRTNVADVCVALAGPG